MTELVLVCFLRGCVCFARQGGFTCVVVFVFVFFAASAALPSCAAFSPRLGEPWVSRDSGGEPGARLHRERQHKWLSDRLLDANRNLKSEGFETPLCHFGGRTGPFLSLFWKTWLISVEVFSNSSDHLGRQEQKSFQIFTRKNVVWCSDRVATSLWVNTQMFLSFQSDAVES